MSDQRPTKSCYIATMHDGYLLEQMSNHYYTAAPGCRALDGVYVSVVFDGNQLDAPVPQNIKDQVSPSAQLFFTESDYDDLIFYYVYVIGSTSAKDFLRRCVDEMINRIPWLECEDDHCDFYHSTIEVLIQFATEFDLASELERLFDALMKEHDQDCQYDGEGECSLLHLLAPYVYNR